jgi:hypothetical protein
LLPVHLLILEPLLKFVKLRIVFLVHFEHLWVVGEVLLVRSPSLLVAALFMVSVLNIEVNCAYMVVINSMLDELHVLVSLWETQLTQFLLNTLRRIHVSVLILLIN